MPAHDADLQRSTGCPVKFVYIHPKSPSDNRRWVGGIVRSRNNASKNLHNHPLHGANKISQCVKRRISDAVSANTTLVTLEKYHSKSERQRAGLNERNWSPYEFEKEADTVDENDDNLSGNSRDKLMKYKKHGRPYLISAGIEQGIRYNVTSNGRGCN